MIMIKRIVLVIIFSIVLTGILAGIKSLQTCRMIAKGEKAELPPRDRDRRCGAFGVKWNYLNE